jgi:DNA-binding MarR family transcriptional regulator
MQTEKELEILEQIKESPEIRQRDLAATAGLSLGMTNAILKRLAEKGWLMIRRINNRNIAYAVTPKGIEEITRRSFRFFKKTIRNVVSYRHSIVDLAVKIKAQGYTGLILVGSSDLDFIVEQACRESGLDFVKDEQNYQGKTFLLYSESYIPEGPSGVPTDGRDFLQKVCM